MAAVLKNGYKANGVKFVPISSTVRQGLASEKAKKDSEEVHSLAHGGGTNGAGQIKTGNP